MEVEGSTLSAGIHESWECKKGNFDVNYVTESQSYYPPENYIFLPIVRAAPPNKFIDLFYKNIPCEGRGRVITSDNSDNSKWLLRHIFHGFVLIGALDCL